MEHSVINAALTFGAQDSMAEGEDVTQNEDLWYLRRLDGGLFTLQNVDYILAWIAMEDDGVSSRFPCSHRWTIDTQIDEVRAHLVQMLDRKNQSMKDIVRTLQTYHDNVDEEAPPSSNGDAEHAPSQKEILRNLLLFLESC
jgi:beta-catenin-like protein 1